ncbi:MAG: hypothetical protein HUJ22_05730 [Gracilimonas sp.]|uniref:TlpA family protein disulfide reductase n=1 Tax=Gracilimonas sp. TaxID=1974203 RepID=UPI0019A28E73|nr:thioredoxin-like domain-containing protein [Gracilimonas sp.]MBD3616055.1 hypothetical protein [Gracilimonas sp.]
MKTILTLSFLLLSISAFSQEQLTVFYFGATDCGPCNRPDVIESIDVIRTNFDSLHSEFETKLVMVTMDENMDEAIKYIQKYEYWDETSMGSRYHNELILAHLNKAEIPGVPHIMIFKDRFEDGGFGTQTIKNREFVKNIMGGDEIVAWANAEMKLD